MIKIYEVSVIYMLLFTHNNRYLYFDWFSY